MTSNDGQDQHGRARTAPAADTPSIVERAAISFCGVTLFVVMLVGAADIISGELFGTFLPFKVDMSGTLTAAAIFLAWPLVQRRRDHIRVDLFLPYLPRPWRLLGWWLGQTMGLLVFGLIAHGAVNMASDSLSIWEQSAATLRYPIWPAKLACAIGAVLTLGIVAVQILRGPRDNLETP